MKVLLVAGARPNFMKIAPVLAQLDALQAAVLLAKLRYLDEWTAGRRRNADAYRVLFASAGLAGDSVGQGRVVLPADVPGHIYTSS
ncbi:MAG: DegT/DnrJ/EryC1/StrS family aminotransferase [Gemmatimonadota bacterium]